MTTQALNFLWLNLDLPAPRDPKDGTIREPMPANYIANVRKATERHRNADIMLWVDSKRLTEKQMTYLKGEVEKGLPNVRVKDLRSIPAYDSEKLYNEGDETALWRYGGQKSPIWLQVDCAKILISLQGEHDQSFFADMDRSHVNITSLTVQRMLKKCGMMIGSANASEHAVENQLWGFKRERQDFFQRYYTKALKKAYDGYNGYKVLVEQAEEELEKRDKRRLQDFTLLIEDDGSRALHPGHAHDSGFYKPKDDKSALAAQWIAAQLRRIPVIRNRMEPRPGYIRLQS